MHYTTLHCILYVQSNISNSTRSIQYNKWTTRVHFEHEYSEYDHYNNCVLVLGGTDQAYIKLYRLGSFAIEKSLICDDALVHFVLFAKNSVE